MIGICDINYSYSINSDFCCFRREVNKEIFIKVRWYELTNEISIEYDPPIEKWTLNGFCYDDLVQYIKNSHDKFLHRPMPLMDENRILKGIDDEILYKINNLINAKIILAERASLDFR